MPIYECFYCTYQTKYKSDFSKHLKTKKHRKNTEYQIENENKLTPINTNEHKMNTKSHKHCDYCNKSFKTHASKRRHELHYCKHNIDNHSKISKKIKEKEKEFLLYKKEMEKQKKELMKQIEILLTKVGNNNNNTTITNNIQLNNYGNEDLSHITNKQKTQMLKIPYVMIQRLIEYVHFNDKKPENKNIMIVNKKDKYIKIFKDGKWIYRDKKETLEMLVDGKYFILDEHFNEIPDEYLSDIQRNRYLIFQNKYDSKDNELHKYLLDKTELFLLNQMDSRKKIE